MRTLTFTHLADPAHGWVKVKRSQLIRFGVLNKITGYSYERGEYVYLEEDCDASTFFGRLNALGQPFKVDFKSTISKQSKVRGYNQFQPRQGEAFASGASNSYLHTKGINKRLENAVNNPSDEEFLNEVKDIFTELFK